MKNAQALNSGEPTPQEEAFSKNELEAVTAVFRLTIIITRTTTSLLRCLLLLLTLCWATALAGVI